MTTPSLKYWKNVSREDKHVSEPFPAEIIQIANDLEALPMTEQCAMIEALAADGADTAEITRLLNHRKILKVTKAMSCRR